MFLQLGPCSHCNGFLHRHEIIPDRTSVHIQEQLSRRDFCDGAKLPCAALPCTTPRPSASISKVRVTYQIGVHNIPDRFFTPQKAIPCEHSLRFNSVPLCFSEIIFKNLLLKKKEHTDCSVT